ncbi:cytochrome c oxidase assembly protein [Plantactinospora sp. KLBMP9567]|uniref:cytochrome c oxidase assembly protein n=1 Tax=Plantactinospora sp. KLBMP9567 TaxID=3085900 RepID=UPI002981942A|nr:cytochrome c oxidase assembly protein [Plantactinospora sp. KLBMP9567]MDW5327923.1 cytochrome c oxidase assembly protein [Plantactinospora sp. KLBMP9567]
MTGGVAHSAAAAGGSGWLPVLLVLAVGAGYLVAAVRARQTPVGWGGRRVAAFLTGIVLVAVALSPGLTARAHHDLRIHMVQHLLVGMYAPLLLVSGRPATLVLRSLPTRSRGPVAAVLRSRAAHLCGHPATALVLNTGGLYLLYLTPLYGFTQASPGWHLAVQVHLLLAGYLLTWSIAGPDPAPRRAGLAVRTAVLVVAAGAHAVLAKLLYAYPDRWPPGTGAPTDDIEDAARLMYYGGDVAEVCLAVLLFAAWYRRRGRRGRAPAPPATAGRRAAEPA